MGNQSNRGKGKGLTFLKEALLSNNDECILWPYYTMKNGYAQVGTHKGMVLAHRYVCIRRYGEPPKGKPQAAHKCGKKNCINPNHLYWANQTENEDDKHSHGTYYKRITANKLNEDIVLKIRSEYEKGLSCKELSEKFKTPMSTIRKVVKRYSWKHI